ncbi:MAG: Fic family protein [Campylobacteraceae bacterium]
MKTYYFEKTHVLELHDWIITTTGGNVTVSNEKIIYLDSMLAQVKNDISYPTFEDKLVHIIFSICKYSPFVDGKKRLALVLGAFFLELNGYEDFIEKFIHNMQKIIVLIYTGKIDKNLLYEIIKSIIYEDEFNENLQQKIKNLQK